MSIDIIREAIQRLGISLEEWPDICNGFTTFYYPVSYSGMVGTAYVTITGRLAIGNMRYDDGDIKGSMMGLLGIHYSTPRSNLTKGMDPYLAGIQSLVGPFIENAYLTALFAPGSREAFGRIKALSGLHFILPSPDNFHIDVEMEYERAVQMDYGLDDPRNGNRWGYLGDIFIREPLGLGYGK